MSYFGACFDVVAIRWDKFAGGFFGMLALVVGHGEELVLADQRHVLLVVESVRRNFVVRDPCADHLSIITG